MKARSARLDYSHVVEARHLGAHRVWMQFADGLAGELDLASELWGPVFEPLRDLKNFRSFKLAEYGTIAWPNGADIAPEFLHEKVHVNA